MRRGARWLLGLVLLVVPRLASAHATLLHATPAANARLATSPARVSLTFSEAIEPGMTHLMLVSAGGRMISLDVSGDAHDVNAITAPIDEQLALGAYRIDWHVVSADGHPVQGSIPFFVGTDVSANALPAEPDAVTDVPVTWGPSALGAPLVPAVLRGLALGALMALAGLLYFRTTAVTERSSLAGNRTMMMLAVISPILLAAHLTAWALDASPGHALTTQSIADAAASNPGHVELLRTGLAILALWACALVRRPRWTLTFTVLAIIASGATGHSAALHPAIAMPFKALHLLAGALWIGGLLWLLTRDRADSTANAAEARRVSGAALAAIIVVAVSGAIQALLFVATPLDVLRTRYGAVVLAKLAGVLVLAAFGAYHRYRVVPMVGRAGDDDSRFRTTLRSELAVMALVTLLGGLLAYIPPAAAPSATARTAHLHSM